MKETSMVVIGLIGGDHTARQLAQLWRNIDYTVIAYHADIQAQNHLKVLNCIVTKNIPELVDGVPVVWITVPHETVDHVLNEMMPHLRPGTIVIDGSESNFNDSIRRAEVLNKIGVSFLDCGLSGGIIAKHGFSVMVGGDKNAYAAASHFFESIAAPLTKDEHGCLHSACAYLGPAGAGHYTKMVHDGIECALMEVYGEGFQLLHDGPFKNLDLQEISRIWQAAIIRSELLTLSHTILAWNQNLPDISGEIGATALQRWAVEAARKEHIPVKLIEDAVAIRDGSHTTGGNFATKLIALLRHKFAGHPVKKLD